MKLILWMRWLLSRPPVNQSIHLFFLFENGKEKKELIWLKAFGGPKAMNEWRNEMDERFHLPRQHSQRHLSLPFSLLFFNYWRNEREKRRRDWRMGRNEFAALFFLNGLWVMSAERHRQQAKREDEQSSKWMEQWRSPINQTKGGSIELTLGGLWGGAHLRHKTSQPNSLSSFVLLSCSASSIINKEKTSEPNEFDLLFFLLS